jgi:predicted MPP superfamily phosphohydrolase
MLFVAIFLGLLSSFVLGHLAIYFCLIKFFSITSLALKNVLILSLIFLSLSFFASTLLSHVRDNAFSRGYYLLSGFWIGLLVNLLLFFGIAWLIVFLSAWLGINPANRILGISAIIAAVIFSAYGVWNAFTPKITSVDVTIKNLPSAWVGKKIVQLSDVHLGHVYREDFITKVVEEINGIKPEVVVITGDLFDGTDGNLDSFLAPLNEINAPVYFAMGNHETYLGLDMVYAAIAKTEIQPLHDNSVEINGLQFIGIDYPLRGSARDISKIIPAMSTWKAESPSVLLIHEPLQIPAAKKLGISLQLSGHTHRGQLFPFGLITSLIFGKFDHGLNVDGDFSIYTSSGLGGWGPAMRTENRSEIVEITLH